MIVGTPASRDLCKRIAEKTQTIVLGFSRGKDAVAAWGWLREFFSRVIPFHVDGCPGVQFIEKSLAYYERWFGVEIERYCSGQLFDAISSMVYQPIEDEDWIDGLGLDQAILSNDEIATCVRNKHDVPDAWIAWAISSADSIVRRSQAKYRNGINEDKRVFYPCFDWKREHVLQAINSMGIGLPQDYLLANRSFASPLNFRHLARMRAQMPDEFEFERVKFFYPLIEAQLARNEFRVMHKSRSATASASENSPNCPLTGSINSTGLMSVSTHANSVDGSTSQHAEEASS